MKNYQRQIVKILAEISRENGYQFRSFCDDFCIEISGKASNPKEKNTTRIFGYQFDNPSSATMIATDKCACFELLEMKNIPSIPHFLILPPEKKKYVETPLEVAPLLEKYSRLVAKPCKGTSGDKVFRFSTMEEYSEIEREILPFSRDIAISPYFEIESEHRCVILNGKALLIYEKIRTSDWKHNLAKGGSAVVCDISFCSEIASLATAAATELKLEFCAVDIAKTNGKYMVLEVNSGVMFERFSQFSKENYQIAKEIYSSGLKHFLKEE